jgi:uncharacterized protein
LTETKIPTNRIEYIDVLRGFTLLGIGLIHMVEQYFAGPAPKAFENFQIKFLGDNIASGIVSFLISGKFFMIFSFLFGLSFFLQLKNSDGSLKFSLRFTWRIIILLLIGLLHHLHYRGDILTIYAMLGVLLVLTQKLPDKVILIMGLLLMLNVPSFIVRGIDLIQFDASHPIDPFAGFMGDDSANEKYFNTLKQGPYLDIIKANFYEHATKMNFQLLSGRIYTTAGLFLLGLYVGRKKVFENFSEKKDLFKKGLRFSLWTLLGCVVFGVAFFGSFGLLGVELPAIAQWTVGGQLMDVFNAAQSLLYCCGLALLFQKIKWQSRLNFFAYVGRMGLTTYLMQTVFGTMIFFGFGLGKLGDIGALTCVGLSIIFFIIQVQFSKWWFNQFTYGPIEWLWRSATLLKIQPIKKLSTSVATH